MQLETELLLIERLQDIGLRIDQRSVGGEMEPYIECLIKDVRIWLYYDGEACIIGRGVDRVFEIYDYDSPEELRAAFLDKLLALF